MKSPSPYRWAACLRQPRLWPLFDIPTHLTDREKLALYRLARSVAAVPGTRCNAVEIGSYLGASSAFLAAGLGSAGRVHCIDTWRNDAMTDGERDTMAGFLANTAPYRDRIAPLRGWSHDPAIVRRAAEAGAIDLLFIDGDHSFDAVLADWTLYAPLLSPGAAVAMHDIGWAEGVQRVVDERIRPRMRTERRLPNLWWGRLA